MMVDDVCGIVLDSEGTPIVLPGYPRTRLWIDSAHKWVVMLIKDHGPAMRRFGYLDENGKFFY